MNVALFLNSARDQLDYFIVGLSMRSEFYPCASYPKLATMGQGEDGKLMVNCYSKLSHKITLSSRTSTTLYVNEIEAYTYGRTIVFLR